MPISLDTYLKDQTAAPVQQKVAQTIIRLADAAVEVHHAIADGGVPEKGHVESSRNPSGETQKALDVFADEAFLSAAIASPVNVYGSEEREEPMILDGDGGLALAIDPLDGSSNIDVNIAVGTIFSLLPFLPEHRGNPGQAYQQPGANQLAAGFFVYGAQLLLVVTVGAGTRTFIHLGDKGGFMMADRVDEVPSETREFAINASNRRHWSPEVLQYVGDAEAGEDGPRGKNFGMRYVGSLVAETYRILQRGGVFLYPADGRKGYREGRLRQIYETNPIAFCIEQAGGAATDGARRMLDLTPASLHARTGFVFGSRGEVGIISEYMSGQPAASFAPSA